jgi:hypothetical protein
MVSEVLGVTGRLEMVLGARDFCPGSYGCNRGAASQPLYCVQLAPISSGDRARPAMTNQAGEPKLLLPALRPVYARTVPLS